MAHLEGPCHWVPALAPLPGLPRAPLPCRPPAVPCCGPRKMSCPLPFLQGEANRAHPSGTQAPPPRSCITWGCRPVVNLSPLKGSLRHVPCTAPSGGRLPGAGFGAGPGLGALAPPPSHSSGQAGAEGRESALVSLCKAAARSSQVSDQNGTEAGQCWSPPARHHPQLTSGARSRHASLTCFIVRGCGWTHAGCERRAGPAWSLLAGAALWALARVGEGVSSPLCATWRGLPE